MSGAVHADRRSEGRCTASGYLCWKAYLPRSSWPTQPTTPIICARPSLPKARSPSSPTTRHGRSNIRSTSISMPSAISWSAASQNSNNSAASQPASKRQPEITVPSSLSQPSSYGCDKCPHHLELGDRSEAEGTRLARRDVVVAIGGRPITLIEDVLDVELHSPVFVDLCVHAGVDADKARQADGVVRRGKRVGKIDHAKSCRPGRVDLVLVPPRELVIGHELDAIAGDDRCGGVAGDTCVRIGIAECRLPNATISVLFSCPIPRDLRTIFQFAHAVRLQRAMKAFGIERNISGQRDYEVMMFESIQMKTILNREIERVLISLETFYAGGEKCR